MLIEDMNHTEILEEIIMHSLANIVFKIQVLLYIANNICVLKI